MEQFGDIDINGDNHLNLDEIFQVDGDGKPVEDAVTKTLLLKDSFKKVC